MNFGVRMAEIFHELAPRCIIAIIMGISSIIGSLVGATLVFAINEKGVKSHLRTSMI